MPSFSDVKYVYDPEALKIMGAAFDTVCHAFPPDLKEHEGARRRLALLILRHMDRGGGWRCSSFDTWIGESMRWHA